jgi:hypothetical protein
MDCMVILFSLRCKWKWEIVPILQPKKETPGARFAFRRLLSDLNSSFHSQSWRVAVAAAVKIDRAEAIACAALQQRQALSTELSEERRKVRQMGRSWQLLWHIPWSVPLARARGGARWPSASTAYVARLVRPSRPPCDRF